MPPKPKDEKMNGSQVQEMRAIFLEKGLTPAQIALILAIGRTRGEAAERLAQVLKELPKA